MATLIDTVANLLDGITVTKAQEILESPGSNVNGIFIKTVTPGDPRMRGSLLEQPYTVVLADNDDPTSPSVSTIITITQPTSNSASSSNSNPTPVVATPPVAVGGGSAVANADLNRPPLSEVSRQNWAKAVFSYKKGTYPNTQRYNDPFGGSSKMIFELNPELKKRWLDLLRVLTLGESGSEAKAFQLISAAEAHRIVDGFDVRIVDGPRPQYPMNVNSDVYYILDLMHQDAPGVTFRIEIELRKKNSNSAAGGTGRYEFGRIVESKILDDSIVIPRRGVVRGNQPKGTLSRNSKAVQARTYRLGAGKRHAFAEMTRILGHEPRSLKNYRQIMDHYAGSRNNSNRYISGKAYSKSLSLEHYLKLKHIRNQRNRNYYGSMLAQGIPGLPPPIVAGFIAPMLGLPIMENEMNRKSRMLNSSVAAGDPVAAASPAAAGGGTVSATGSATASGDPVAADKEKKRRFVTRRKQTSRRRRNTRRR